VSFISLLYNNKRFSITSIQEGAAVELSKREGSSQGDMFGLLLEKSKKQERGRREELLKPLGIREFFDSGSIRINYRTCQGLECELCIKACPTKALYWWNGKVGIIEDLCVYCGACVINCIVDDCISIERRRLDGKAERFSKPREVILLYRTFNAGRRHSRIESIFPEEEADLKRFKRQRR